MMMVPPFLLLLSHHHSSSYSSSISNSPLFSLPAPPSPSSKASLEETGDKKHEDEQPTTPQALLEETEAAPKVGGWVGV